MNDLNPKYRYNNVGTFASLANTGLEAAAKYLFESKAKREHSRALKRARDARYKARKRAVRAASLLAYCNEMEAKASALHRAEQALAQPYVDLLNS